MDKVLVTGGAGYVGRVLVRQLLEAGHGVRVFDAGWYGGLDALRAEGAEVVEGDVRRLPEPVGLFGGVACVVHLAGVASAEACREDLDRAADIDVDSTRELAQQALASGVGRFVLASTWEVFGAKAPKPADEAAAPLPDSDAGRLAVQAEEAVRSLAQPSFEVITARLGELLGAPPRMRVDRPLLRAMTAEGRVAEAMGGSRLLPALHVADAAAALMRLALDPPAEHGGAIHVVLPQGAMSCLEAAAVRQGRAESGREACPCTSPVTTRYAEILWPRGPAYGIGEAAAEAWAWLQNHPEAADEPRFDNAKTLAARKAVPVDEGGEPAAPKLVALYKPTTGPEEERVVAETLRSGWLTSAARVVAFEKELAKTVHAPCTIAVNSCTEALHLCLVHHGVEPGGEVIMTPITWGSTVNTVIHMGATPVLVDVDPETLNMDPQAVAKAITPKTQAIMPVHLAGHPAELDEIHAAADPKGIPVIEDAAHALGAAYKGQQIGQYAPYACYSFYAIKNITTIEGGAVALHDEEAAEHFRRLAGNGMGLSAWDRYGRSAGMQLPEIIEPGFKARMHDVSAAIGLEQLKRFPAMQQRRYELAMRYYEALADIEEIVLPVSQPHVTHAWHLFMIRLRLDGLKQNRDEIRQALRNENVGTGVHFYGLHLHEYVQKRYGYAPEDLPVATEASRSLISLPLFPRLEDVQAGQVAAALKKVIAFARA